MSLTDLKDCQNDPNLTANGKTNEILSQVDITSNTTLSYDGASIHQHNIEF